MLCPKLNEIYLDNWHTKRVRSNTVLRGEGINKTVLYFPITLTDVKPDWGGNNRRQAHIQLLQDQSLATSLYHGEGGDMSHLEASSSASIVVAIKEIHGNIIAFDRPLRFDIGSKWNPIIKNYNPSVENCGIENLAIVYPTNIYEAQLAMRIQMR